MYGKNPVADIWRFFRAVLTNQIARELPRLYVKLTGQTGRGQEPESVQQIAEYFWQCFHDYFRTLGIPQEQIEEYLMGKQVLEYGPGDVPAVGVLMLAHGAASVVCVDRFPLYSLSKTNVQVLSALMNKLPAHLQERAQSIFVKEGDPASGFLESRLRYLVSPSGLSGLEHTVDLIVSRAVLEHVDDLDSTFVDIQRALRTTGVAVHQVDLKSHGLHQQNPLDFLTWPQHLWTWMYGRKGYINRWRLDRYRAALTAAGLQTLLLQPTARAGVKEMQEVRPHLAAPFRQLTEEDLSCLGFWLVCAPQQMRQAECDEKTERHLRLAARF